ncbi:MAG: error-prone DNA polymerase [Pseudomonadota bacterium]
MSPLPDYAELRCLSNFSFLKGASHPGELVERAKALGYRALALSDECSLAGIVRAHVAAEEHQLHLIVGSQFQVDGPSPFTLIALACNLNGYGNLCEFITRLRRSAPKGSYHLRQADIVADTLTDCLILVAPERRSTPLQRQALGAWLRTGFEGRAWWAVEQLCLLDDDAWLHQLRELSAQSGLPLVACGDVHMHLRSRKPLQDVLTAIRVGRPLTECGWHLQPNAERHLRSRVRLAQRYPAELLAQTLVVAQRCQFSLKSLRYQYPAEVVPAGQTPTAHLRHLTEAGVLRRWPEGASAKVREQIEHELHLIAELRYEHYFLTVADIVHFARSQGILCQGRGSAANSVVCYCLGVTEVDPAQLSTLFERFISRERNEPPDIDVDFEHERREEVVQFLYRKYGRDRAALAATVISYRPKSALRDVGKALGFDLATLERLSAHHAWWDEGPLSATRLEDVGLDPQSLRVRQLRSLSVQLMGFPRHLSQHTGGFVLTHGPLCRMVPIENATMADRSVIEWDKDDLDAVGLLKVDVLALGMLTALRKALDLVQTTTGRPWRLQDIPQGDVPTYDMICAADTVGVFQIESRAQQSMLPRLRPRCFYDLVVEVAIVRPGPIQGGMVHPYLNRRIQKEPVTYPSEALRGALERTLGVPIFQEQVMQISIVAAGFTAGEADQLRRAMASWRRQGSLEAYHRKLVDGMRERGYDPAFAESIFEQIKGFSEYGFPESHSASFAILVYASCWIKRHHPAAFLTALLNSQPMGFYPPSQLVQDAQRHGVRVQPVDVNHSDVDATLNGPPDQLAVRLGLRLVDGLGRPAAQRIEAARRQAPFASVSELAQRAALDRQALQHLAAADALQSLSGHRRQQAWDASAWQPAMALLREAPPAPDPWSLPAASEGEDIVDDYATLGLTLRRHPLALLRPALTRRRVLSAAELNTSPAGRLVSACGLVTTRQRPPTANGTAFITLEDETGVVQVICWKRVAEAQRNALLQSRLLMVKGVWQREGEVRHLVAGHLHDLTPWLGRLATQSRDFH